MRLILQQAIDFIGEEVTASLRCNLADLSPLRLTGQVTSGIVWKVDQDQPGVRPDHAAQIIDIQHPARLSV
jgi:hypothetical protein